jgi:hypothetical protein
VSTTERILADAHRLAASATGAVSLALASKSIRRSQVKKCVRELREAADTLELLGKPPLKK